MSKMSKKNNAVVYIDPRCRINYASYYILGLFRIYGMKSVKFDVRRFEEIKSPNAEWAQSNGFFFIVSTAKDNILKIYVDFHDADLINDSVHEWVDIYAKINLNLGYDADKYFKILPIGPSFAVDIWSWTNTFYYGIKHLLIARHRSSLSRKNFLKDYFYLKFRRRPLSDYLQTKMPKSDYLFSISTLWYDQLTATTTNFLRGRFYRASRRHFKRFEGGFYYIKDTDVVKRFPQYEKYIAEYHDCLYYRRIKMAEYIEKSKASFLVFNTASVSGCLGWKLGEYLCMGKAIISSPLNKVMPNDGDDIKFAHFVENEADIEEAILLLKNNKVYKEELERNAKEYFDKYLSPEAVIARIIAYGLDIKLRRNNVSTIPDYKIE